MFAAMLFVIALSGQQADMSAQPPSDADAHGPGLPRCEAACIAENRRMDEAWAMRRQVRTLIRQGRCDEAMQLTVRAGDARTEQRVRRDCVAAERS